MVYSSKIIRIAVFSLILCLTPDLAMGQKPSSVDLLGLISDAANVMPVAKSGVYVSPADSDMANWEMAIKLFRLRSADSAKLFFSRLNYQIIYLKDASSGNEYDVIQEKLPIRRGWGTYIYNRDYKKRLHIHINHPLDDPHALTIGAQLFRYLNGEWLLIGGTSKRAVSENNIADMGKANRSIFQRTHEILTDLTHVALSIHSYDEQKYLFPINETDAIVSNGTTSDQQWGISQISLAFRDSLRNAGFRCGLAMYDSGYAPLSGGWNPQGIFSNDSVGFGHWLYLELSKTVRENKSQYQKLFSSIGKALDLTGKRISQQVNRAFGLVSPRVVRLNSLNRLYFPSKESETYRIVSLNPSSSQDTIDISVGSWMEMLGSKNNISKVTLFDTTKREINPRIKGSHLKRTSSVVSKIVKPSSGMTSVMHFREEPGDSSVIDERDKEIREPIQVHRIPLKPLLHQTYYPEMISDESPYHWKGLVQTGSIPDASMFEFHSQQMGTDELRNLPNFLIPIINGSFYPRNEKFIGVRMTDLLLTEITRLVTEYKVVDKDIGLIAEQSDEGGYFLRIFPKMNAGEVVNFQSN